MNDMERVILVDCDGVLLNWEYAFKVWMSHNHYLVRCSGTGYGDQYDICHLYGITPDDTMNLIRQFNESAAMGFLPPLRDAIQYVTKLHREYGFVFHCITAMSENENAQKLRKMNLRKIFGDTTFEKFVFLDTGRDKDEVLAPYKDSGLLWIEDKFENALLCQRLGLDSVLIEHKHNMREFGKKTPDWKEGWDIPRMKDWKSVYNYITGE